MKNATLGVLVLCSVLANTGEAAEGMWMPQQVPELGDQLKQMGLKIDPDALADLTGAPMGAIVSTGGCSASFVSELGLAVTNHHCVAGWLQYNSTPEKNLLANGILAKTMQEEPHASPDARIWVTTAVEDVTREITGKLGAKLSDVERQEAMELRRKNMISVCEKGGGLRCLVSSFFEGSQYLKTTQMEIRDVRLVYAPAEGVGVYGGEVDNWIWPRHTGDFGFFRAYVGKDGKPADHSRENVPYRPKHWLKISIGDIDPGDLMLVIGYPGMTWRYKTAEEVAASEEIDLPRGIEYRRSMVTLLEERGKTNEEVRIRNASRVRGYANYLKKYEGTLDSFKKSGLVARRVAEERAIASLLASDPRASRELSSTMTELNRRNGLIRKTLERDVVLGWLYSVSPMLSQANTLYRMSVERARPDVDRKEGYQERDWARLEAQVTRVQRSLDLGSDQAGLRYMLLEALKLPPDQRIKAVDDALAATGQSSAKQKLDAFLDRLYADTAVARLDQRLAMFDEPTATLLARNDSMIRFAAALRELGDANERRDDEHKGAMSRLRPIYVATLRKLRVGLLAPDANGTLRLSFGKVEGYAPRDAVRLSPQTTIEGILEKETGEDPFKSPPRLLEIARAKQFGPYADPDLGTLPVNFVSSGDITNGSSGSATLNAQGELCALAFDGNLEAVGSDYLVDPDVTRAIHVDARYMLWVMDAVDSAHNLLREMGLPVHFAP